MWLPNFRSWRLVAIVVFTFLLTILVVFVVILGNRPKQPLPEPVHSVKLTGDQAKLPNQFPSELIYPNATLDSVIDSKTGYAVSFTTADSLGKTSSFFEQAFQKTNWQFQQLQKSTNALHYSFSKEKLTGGLTLVKNDIYESTKAGRPNVVVKSSKTTITINLNKNPSP